MQFNSIHDIVLNFLNELVNFHKNIVQTISFQCPYENSILSLKVCETHHLIKNFCLNQKLHFNYKINFDNFFIISSSGLYTREKLSNFDSTIGNKIKIKFSTNDYKNIDEQCLVIVSPTINGLPLIFKLSKCPVYFALLKTVKKNFTKPELIIIDSLKFFEYSDNLATTFPGFLFKNINIETDFNNFYIPDIDTDTIYSEKIFFKYSNFIKDYNLSIMNELLFTNFIEINKKHIVEFKWDLLFFYTLNDAFLSIFGIHKEHQSEIISAMSYLDNRSFNESKIILDSIFNAFKLDILNQRNSILFLYIKIQQICKDNISTIHPLLLKNQHLEESLIKNLYILFIKILLMLLLKLDQLYLKIYIIHIIKIFETSQSDTTI